MNDRKRMIARMQKQIRTKQKHGVVTLNDLANAMQKLGNAMRTLGVSAESVTTAMDWSKNVLIRRIEE